MALFGKDETGSVELNRELLPRHVAIIMDGNGRWAQRRGMPRSFGHKAGVEALREIIRHSDHLGIEALTIYAFSTENWKRSAEEVGALMGLLLEYFTKELDELHREHVRIRIIGDIDDMPKGLEKQQAALRNAMERTKENTGLKLNIALNYGGRQEIVQRWRRKFESTVPAAVTAALESDGEFLQMVSGVVEATNAAAMKNGAQSMAQKAAAGQQGGAVKHQ